MFVTPELQAEAIVWLLVCFALMVLFILQIVRGERFSPVKRSSIKYLFHRIGLLSSGICVVRGIDPFGARHIYSFNLRTFLEINVTAVMTWCLLLLCFNSHKALYAGDMKPVPAVWVVLYTLMGVITVLSANIVYTLALGWDRDWVIGVHQLWLGVMMLLMGFSLMLITYALVDRLRMNPSMNLVRAPSRLSIPDRNESTSGTLERRNTAVYVFCVAVSFFEFTLGSARLSRHGEGQVFIVDHHRDEYVIQDRLFPYLQVIAIAMTLWYGWLPLRPGRANSMIESPRSPNSPRFQRGISSSQSQHSDSLRKRNASSGGASGASGASGSDVIAEEQEQEVGLDESDDDNDNEAAPLRRT